MKNFLMSIFVLVLIFSCASNPSGGGGGGGSSSLVNQNNPSQTLENTPDLKLKLKDMPDSLSDESLKLKSILKEALTMPVTNIPDVKGFAWFMMASFLQNAGDLQSTLEELKQFAKEYQIPLNQAITLYEDQQYGISYKVKVTTDGGSGLRYYFIINMMGFSIKYYIHIYPVGNSIAGEFIYEIDYDGEIFRMFASFDGSTGNIENSLNTSEEAFFYKVNWLSSDSVNIIVGSQVPQSGANFIIAEGNNNSGGVLFVDTDDEERYYEYYNNKGGLVLQRYSTSSEQLNKSLLKYLSLATSYSSYTMTRNPTNTNYINQSGWVWGDFTNDINITNIYYSWWLDKNTNNTFNPGDDFLINISYEPAYSWSSIYNCIVPVDAPFYYWNDTTGQVYFVFNETNIVSTMSNKLENLYNQWKNTNIITYITNRQIPNPENFPQ